MNEISRNFSSESIQSGNLCCSSNYNVENKFVIMADDTKECRKAIKCNESIKGSSIQQIFIDLSDCHSETCKKEECNEKNVSDFIKK